MFECLVGIVHHFKLYDALTAIKAYEIEEQIYHKKLTSATFAEELQKEIQLMGHKLTVNCTIAVYLNWSSTKIYNQKI